MNTRNYSCFAVRFSETVFYGSGLISRLYFDKVRSLTKLRNETTKNLQVFNFYQQKRQVVLKQQFNKMKCFKWFEFTDNKTLEFLVKEKQTIMHWDALFKEYVNVSELDSMPIRTHTVSRSAQKSLLVSSRQQKKMCVVRLQRK